MMCIGHKLGKLHISKIFFIISSDLEMYSENYSEEHGNITF